MIYAQIAGAMMSGKAPDETPWRFDPQAWSGSERDRILYVHDLVFESPSGHTAAVVYSIDEIRMGWYVGRLAVLGGDPARPTVLFRPEVFLCMGFGNSVSWIEPDRYLAVQAFMYQGRANRLEVPFCLLDLVAQQYTYYPVMNACIATVEATGGRWVIRESERDKRFVPHDGEVIERERLTWLPWREIGRRREHYFGGLFGQAS